jgi:hypothetical protein
MAMEIASSKGRLHGGGGSHGSTISLILVIWPSLLIWLIGSPFFWPAQITNKNPWIRTWIEYCQKIEMHSLERGLLC